MWFAKHPGRSHIFSYSVLLLTRLESNIFISPPCRISLLNGYSSYSTIPDRYTFIWDILVLLILLLVYTLSYITSFLHHLTSSHSHFLSQWSLMFHSVSTDIFDSVMSDMVSILSLHPIRFIFYFVFFFLFQYILPPLAKHLCLTFHHAQLHFYHDWHCLAVLEPMCP